MSGLPYQGGMNSYMFDMTQYGTSMPSSQSMFSNLLAGLAGNIPFFGPLIGAGINMLGTWMQNRTQEEFYNRYMSPQARMAQMKAAGINPNAAAQGIAGAASPQMTAAAPTNSFSSLGEQLGQSANNALTAGLIKSETEKNNSEKNLTDSLNVEKSTTNKYLDQMQIATLNKLVEDGKISKSFANMAAVDEAYKPAVAYANYQQLLTNLNKTNAEIVNLNASAIQAYAQAYQAMQYGNLAEAQIHKVFSDIGLNNAMIKKIAYECDVLEAQELSVYQDINESKARTMALDIQNKFQQEYFEIWQNTGFNWNSDIEKSIVGAYQNYQLEDANRIMKGLQNYIINSNDAAAGSDKYIMDYIGDLSKSLTGAVGLGLIARIATAGGSSGLDKSTVDKMNKSLEMLGY